MSIAVHLTARSHIATLAPTRPWSYTRCNVHAAENEFSLMLSPALNAAQNVPDSVSPSYGYPIRWMIWVSGFGHSRDPWTGTSFQDLAYAEGRQSQ